jgi:DNA-binding NtrC family response regulator
VSESKLVLVVDDDPDFLRIAELLLDHQGFRACCANSDQEAFRVIGERTPDVVLLDQQLGQISGLELLHPLKQRLPDVPVVLVTAHSTVEAAVQAIKRGAFDFLPKPIDEARLVATLAKAVEHRRLLQRVRTLEGAADGESGFDDLVGGSPQMQTIYRIIRNVARTEATVMIVGESGTGKELIARAIHRTSPRSDEPFVALNMGALPKDLIESTLFGHERGAFTGADKRRIGACEEASGGTLFLDEIREMPIDTQPKLLRFLQERTLRRVGGTSDLQADVRIISATNSDPLQDVRDKRLREDLYYRLNVVPVVVPPLRERRGDVALLAMRAMQQCAARHARPFDSIEDEALARLASCRWPGNVRQLFHTIERIVVLNEGPVLRLSMLPEDLDAASLMGGDTPVEPEGAPSRPAVGAPERAPEVVESGAEPLVPLVEMERKAILRAVKEFGSAAKAARHLGISEATIYRRLREYGIKGSEVGI